MFSIAHRLNTVIEFDRILVMDAGQLVEFDRPTTLLRKKGHFYMLCKNTGRENFLKLKEMALAVERKNFPELGEIDGIDDNFVDGEAENPDLVHTTVEDKKALNKQEIMKELEDADDSSEEPKEKVKEPAPKEEADKVKDESKILVD